MILLSERPRRRIRGLRVTRERMQPFSNIKMKWWLIALLLPLLLTFSYFITRGNSVLVTLQITHPVRIERDENGAPHIYAKALDDAMFAYGYAVAEDRLWQLDLARRVATGTVSELVGEKGVPVDIFIRNVRIPHYAREDVKRLPDVSYNILKKYCDGVNYYINSHYLPIQYWITMSTFEKIEPEHLHGIGFVLGVGLNHFWGTELLRYKLEALLGPKASELIPLDIETIRKITPIVADSELPRDLRGVSGPVSDPPPYEDYVNAKIPGHIEGVSTGGSNAWAISGKYTKSGKPLLANDPHLECRIPSFWYFVSIHIEDFGHVEGLTSPGLVTIPSGRNQNVAWGITSLKVDGIDFFVEKISEGKAYYDGDWYELESFTETINVKGKEPLEIAYSQSRHGPILNSENFDGPKVLSAFFTKSSLSAGLSMKSYLPFVEDDILGMFHGTFTAKSIDDFKDKVNKITGGYHATLMADDSNNIAFFTTGHIPKRKTPGDFPVPGWLSEYDWEGVYPTTENPRSLNPEKGFIVMANNYPTDQGYKHFSQIGRFFVDGRAERATEMINELISKGRKMDISDMMNIQVDTLNIFARDHLPVMLQMLPSNNLTYAVKLLNDWDYTMTEESLAASIYSSWMRHISFDLLSDQISDETLLKDLVTTTYYNSFVYGMFSNSSYFHWCDNLKTDKVETCGELLLSTLHKATSEITDPWGRTHTVHLKSSFHSVPILNWIFDRYRPAGGQYVTINAVHNFWGRNLTGEHGPNMRMITDLGDPSNNHYILEGGTSGNILSKHYDDMLPDFSAGKYRSWSFNSHQTVVSTVINPKE